MFDRYINWIIGNHRAVVCAAIAVVVFLSYGITGLTITNDMRAYFSPDNPQLQAFDTHENVYDKQDTVSFVVVAREGDIFTRKNLTLLAALTELGWQAPYSRRSSSIANHQHTWAVDDEMFVADLIPVKADLNDAAVERIKTIALTDPGLVSTLVSVDGVAAIVVVTLTFPKDALDANDVVVRWAEAALPKLREQNPRVDIHLAGTTTTNVTLGEAVARDLGSLITLSYLIIVAGLFLLLRHLGAVLSTVAIITMAIASTMGMFGWFGVTLEALAGFVPSIVMTIAVADSVHILTGYYHELRRGSAKHDAIAESLRINAPPVFITSITTIIGVLTLNFSDSPPYRDLGNMIAVGVAWAMILSMTFLPALIAWLPVRNLQRGAAFERIMSRFADFVVDNSNRLLFVIGATIIVLASFIPNNVLTENWHEYFDDSFAARRSLDAIDRHFGWLHTIRYSISSGEAQGVHDPTYLDALEGFARWYEEQPEVVHVARLTHIVNRLSMNMHADDPSWYRIPDSPELAAQYLLLFELSLPLGLGLENAINVDRSASQLVVYVKRTDSEQLPALDVRARDWVQDNAPSLHVAEGTGIDMMFAHINHRNIRGLLKGMVVALVLISIVLILALRSLRLGLLSLITNLAPGGLAYGTWAIVNGRIDMSASVVMCMSIGIVVDDTVHFLSKYRRARRERGLYGAEGMRYAFNTVGVALTVTTVVLVGGFLVLTASPFSPTNVTGRLMAMTLAYALFVDFLFMPPLLIALDKRWRQEE